MASPADMRSRGLIQPYSVFTRYSLGECSALAALAEVMPIEPLASVACYRAPTMQVPVERDPERRSGCSMIAVDPNRISKAFHEQALQYIDDDIAEVTKYVLEVVNYSLLANNISAMVM